MTTKVPNISTRRDWLAAASGMIAAPAVLAQPGSDAPGTRDARGNGRQIIKRFDFSRGTGGVLPGFTDYDLNTADLRFLAEVRDLPREAYYLSNNNRPDDLFMFLKVPLTAADGILSGTTYKLSLQVELASNSTNCVGTGGSESAVMLKAGGMLRRTYDHPTPITTIHEQLWIAVGTESGYESVTSLYYYSIDVKLTRLDQ